MGDKGEEIVPRDAEDMAVEGLKDERYDGLVNFMEEEQDWNSAGKYFQAYKIDNSIRV